MPARLAYPTFSEDHLSYGHATSPSSRRRSTRSSCTHCSTRPTCAILTRSAHVVTQSHTPLVLGKLMDNTTVTSVAGEYGKTPRKVLLRWNLQLGKCGDFSARPKPSACQAISYVFDFEWPPEHMEAIRWAQRRHPGARGPETYDGV